jgi:hypothetical protein
MTDYEEFRLRIRGPIDGRYSVDSSGPGGEGSGDFELPFNEDQLKIFVLTIGASRGRVRKLESKQSEAAREFGGALFNAVMSAGNVGATYRQALLAHPQLRLTLSLDKAASLMAVPWEFLYDQTDFIATSPDTPVVRSLDVAQPPRPLEVELPLRILVVSAQPTDAEAINAGLERESLEPALKPLSDRNAVVLDWLEHATLDSLNDKLFSGAYHIIHFIGHGGFVMGEGALVFENDQNLSDIVGADRFAPILKPRKSIRLVVLNSCEGARSDVKDPFSGVAASLIERGLPAAIGMQFEISDPAAIKFAKHFYAVLAAGNPVDQALAEARLAMFAGRDDVEWATPVLFMRGSSGQLFEISNAVSIPPAALRDPVPPAGPPQPPAGPPLGPSTPPGAPEGGRPRNLETGRPIDTTAVPRVSWPSAIRRRIAGLSPRTRLALVGAGAAVVLAGVIAFVLLGSSQGARIAVTTGSSPGMIVVEGSGFQADEVVKITINHRDTFVPARADGTVSPTIDTHGFTAGEVIAEGQISKRTATTQFALPTLSPSVAGESAGPSTGGSTAPSPDVSPTSSASTATGDLWCFDPATRKNLIVFYSDEPTGRYDLYCADPGTPNRYGSVPIKDAEPNDRPDWFVGWSPNHDKMIFTRGSQGAGDILTLGEDLIPQGLSVTRDDDWFPAWSAADDIAFIRGRGAGTAVWRREHDQTQAQFWFDAPNIASIAWSPGGGTLAFFGRSNQPNRTDFAIGTVIADGARPAYIIDNDGRDRFGANDMNPTWSPDGRKIAFVRATARDPSTNDIWVFDRGTHRQTRLTGTDIDHDGAADDGSDVQDGNPVWSPDGRQIAFYRASSAGGFQIWVMNADGSDPHNIMPDRAGRNLDPNWR